MQAEMPRAVKGHRAFLIIPAFNEEGRIAEVLERVGECALALEVVVVDDGSTDQTATIAEASGARALRHPFNLGYGTALQTGYKYAYRAGATLVAQMDADGQHDPRQLSRLIEPVARGDADLVIGSRFLAESSYRMGIARTAGRRLFQALAKGSGLRITDPTSGFQAMNRKVVELYSGDFFPSDYPDLDILLLANRLGVRIEEQPVTMAHSTRASYLHSGLAPIYYLYRMTLSIWAGWSGNPPELPQPDEEKG